MNAIATETTVRTSYLSRNERENRRVSKLFTEALRLITSDSLREWARSQRAVWVRHLRRNPMVTDPVKAAVFIQITAMGM